MARIDGGNMDVLFQQAFDGAELAPNPDVWNNVKAELHGQTNWKRLLAWAAVISSAFAAAIVFAPRFENVAPEVVQQSQPDPVQNQTPVVDQSGAPFEKTEDPSHLIAKQDQNIESQEEQVSDLALNTEFRDEAVSDAALADVPVESSINIIAQGPHLDIDIISWEPVMVPFWKKKMDPSKSHTWAQAGFGTGSTGSYEGISFAQADAVAEAAFASDSDGASELQYRLSNTQMETSGSSFTTGVQLGTNMGRKWLIQSGVGVTSTKLNGSTNAIENINGNRYPVLYQTRFGGDVSYTSPIPISTQLQFITIPVQVGFRVIDKNVGWVFYSGVNAQILFSQKLTSSFDDYKIPDSPYRTFYPEFTLGTELNYRFLKNYQLGVQGGFGVGLTEITRPESPFQWTPSQRSVGIFLRYMFD